jgi:hypothetical protein
MLSSRVLQGAYMSENPVPSRPSDDLQFDVVETANQAPSQSPAPKCAICKTPIDFIYYALRDDLLCQQCRDRLLGPRAGGFGRFLYASAFGLAAATAGALLWYAIRVATDHELGIVAVGVGYVVGKAVRKGSGNWGGRGFQFLAVLLTYLSIAATYLPIVIEARNKGMQARRAKVEAANRDAANAKPKANAPNDEQPQEEADKPVHAGHAFGPVAAAILL